MERLDEWKYQWSKGNVDFVFEMFELVEDLKSSLEYCKLNAEVILENGYDETAMDQAARIIEIVQSKID